MILDSGSKTLTNDGARVFEAPGYGVVLKGLESAEPRASLRVERVAVEHATARAVNGESALKTATLVRVIPNHSCVVSNLVDRIWLVDGHQVVSQLPVAARGRIV